MHFGILYTCKHCFRSLPTLLSELSYSEMLFSVWMGKNRYFWKRWGSLTHLTSLLNVNMGQCNDILVSEFVRWQTVVILFILYILINPFGDRDLVKHLVAINNLYLKYVFCESFTRVLNWSQCHLNIYFTVIFPHQTSSSSYLCNENLNH